MGRGSRRGRGGEERWGGGVGGGGEGKEGRRGSGCTFHPLGGSLAIVILETPQNHSLQEVEHL